MLALGLRFFYNLYITMKPINIVVYVLWYNKKFVMLERLPFEVAIKILAFVNGPKSLCRCTLGTLTNLESDISCSMYFYIYSFLLMKSRELGMYLQMMILYGKGIVQYLKHFNLIYHNHIKKLYIFIHICFFGFE